VTFFVACVLWAWAWNSVTYWDCSSDENDDMPVDDVPDVPPQLRS